MKKITAVLLFACVFPLQAAENAVRGLRLWAAPDQTRLVFDVSDPVEHRLFALHAPERLVVDLKQTNLKTELPRPSADDPILRGLRSAVRDGTDLRVVLDLKAPVRPKSFLLKPNDSYGHRLVIDLYPKQDVAAGTANPPSHGPAIPDDNRDVVIAIDAGHGGEDPGARGRRGTREKDVVLAIARQLERLIKAERGMRPVMIRSGDYYLGLRQRMVKAREHKADLFISIHADAFNDSRARGASVYTLSRKGASSEAARWLAEKENAADLVGGVSLDDKDDVLASVLLDLSQTATQQASVEAANEVISELKGLGSTHKQEVQKAGFMVLKSPDIPSMLVETAFISNPAEERKLADPNHQRRIAKAILAGVRDYFQRNPPPGTLLAAAATRQHRIARGETLSEIAQQYQISLNTLREANGIKGDRIRIGQVLAIP